MSDLWVVPERLFDGQRLVTAGLRLRQGRVVEVGEAPPGALRLRGLVTPGFVDLQVNGGGGVLVNATPTPEGLRAIAAAHAALGTAAILPTVITDARPVIEAAAEAALAVRDDPRILGLHIEGPHIAMARRGTHAAAHVRPMEAETIALVTRLRAAGLPVKITLAPEAASLAQIAELAATGAIVSLGHTDADAGAVRRALEAGASCFTHLFNAMSPMLNRAPGVTGAAIASDAHCGIICDGIHVDDAMVGIALRARPVADRMFLVSDAMPTVGGPDVFDLYGMRIRLKDGRLINDEGSLAGAHVTQAEGVARLVRHVGVPLEDALRMALSVPAALIGAGHLAAVAGRDAEDLVVMDGDLSLVGTLAAQLAARAAS